MVESDENRPSNQAFASIDAGIVFADETSYLCIPFSRVGVADRKDVLSVTTSCECTSASIVQFVDVNAQLANALRVDFTPESAASESQTAAVNLGIVITLRLANDRELTFMIKCVHSVKPNTE